MTYRDINIDAIDFNDHDSVKQLIKMLVKRIIELEGQNAKNSRNSSKPPSSDGFNKPKPKSLQKKSKKKSGGQPGHKGHTLGFSQNPDRIERIHIDNCPHCGRKVCSGMINGYEARQSIELIIKTEVVEHRADIIDCDCGKINTAEFPEYLGKKVQYGISMVSFFVYMNQYQFIPLKRACELIEDTTGHCVSQGTINNAIIRCYEKLELFELHVKALLIKAAVVGFDQTGIRCEKKSYWILVACTLRLTLLYFHRQKGKVAMNEFGILPQFEGIAVHDFDRTFFYYLCEHALCCAHLLRELLFLFDEERIKWAGEMIDLLYLMLEKVKTAKDNGKTHLSKITIFRLTIKYRSILKSAVKKVPLSTERTGTRGRVKQTKERNLLDRLSDKEHEILHFLRELLLTSLNLNLA